MRRLSFILASASPRRRKLIKSFPFPVLVRPSRAHEPRARADEDPRAYCLALARKKAFDVAGKVKSGLVLGADTIVYHRGKVLGKPASAAEARRMLAALSGGWHDVYTALCLAAVPGGRAWMALARTRVRMRRFTDEQLDALARKNHDKAGAYAAQSGRFVTGYRGDFDNVVGLPRRALRGLLRKAEKAGFRPA